MWIMLIDLSIIWINRKKKIIKKQYFQHQTSYQEFAHSYKTSGKEMMSCPVIFCPFCGKPMRFKFQFCMHCGEKLDFEIPE